MKEKDGNQPIEQENRFAWEADKLYHPPIITVFEFAYGILSGEMAKSTRAHIRICGGCAVLRESTPPAKTRQEFEERKQGYLQRKEERELRELKARAQQAKKLDSEMRKGIYRKTERRLEYLDEITTSPEIANAVKVKVNSMLSSETTLHELPWASIDLPQLHFRDYESYLSMVQAPVKLMESASRINGVINARRLDSVGYKKLVYLEGALIDGFISRTELGYVNAISELYVPVNVYNQDVQNGNKMEVIEAGIFVLDFTNNSSRTFFSDLTHNRSIPEDQRMNVLSQLGISVQK